VVGTGRPTALLVFRFTNAGERAVPTRPRVLRDAQRWLRDTDAVEKISYFEEIALDDDHPMAAAAQEPYDQLYRTARSQPAAVTKIHTTGQHLPVSGHDK
jgi:hypothetical protein